MAPTKCRTCGGSLASRRRLATSTLPDLVGSKFTAPGFEDCDEFWTGEAFRVWFSSRGTPNAKLFIDFPSAAAHNNEHGGVLFYIHSTQLCAAAVAELMQAGAGSGG